MFLCVMLKEGTTFSFLFFFFNDTATTEIYTLSLHDALPISKSVMISSATTTKSGNREIWVSLTHAMACSDHFNWLKTASLDRKSTRLNSSHGYISYAVFCLKKKKKIIYTIQRAFTGIISVNL